MGYQADIYGLDIETDTRRRGHDPAVASITRIGLSGHNFDEVFTGPEPDLLHALDDRLSRLSPGVLATWNGSVFDLPFIADRARLAGVDLGLDLCLDRGLTLDRTPLPGHPGAYRANWHLHGHIDTYRLYGIDAPSGNRISLRSVARLLGIGTHAVGSAGRRPDLAAEVLHAHAPSDARLARVLATRRWAAAQRIVDRVTAAEAVPVAVAAGRLARQAKARTAGVGPAVASA